MLTADGQQSTPTRALKIVRMVRSECAHNRISVLICPASHSLALTADHSIYLNVRDFGAKGDNVTDDTVALQSAIDYAQRYGRALSVPAGYYRISSTLFIRWTENDDCSVPTCPGTHHPLRFFGESMYATAIVAAANFSCAASGEFRCAVLSMPAKQAQGVPPWKENFGKTTTDHEISHIGFDGSYKTRFGV
eukprot:SAG31_NODE_20410_length_575_cov_1.168067_1_plen_191_part_11